MNQVITLLAFTLLASLFAYGQETEIDIENHENLWKSEAELELCQLKSDDQILCQYHLLNKDKNYQNSSLNPSGSLRKRLDSIISQNWYQTTGQQVTYKSEYLYNMDGINMSTSYFVWDKSNSQWTADEKQEYNYDIDWNMTQIFSYNWDQYSKKWAVYSKKEYTYDVKGNMILFDYYEWDQTTNKWVASKIKVEYTYDTDGKMTQTISYIMHQYTKQWNFSSKGEYYYDTNGNRKQIFVYEWDKSKKKWMAYNLREYAYNVSGNLIQILIYERDQSISKWVDYIKDEYTYDPYGNKLQWLRFYWDQSTGLWSASFKENSSYNNSHTFSDLIVPFWYSSNSMLIGQMKYDWNKTYNVWVSKSRDTCYYSEQNVTAIPEIKASILNVYPNPFSANVSFNISGYDDYLILELFDMLGRKVMNKTIRNHEKVNLEDLNNGLYIYILIINGKRLTGKLIKE
jgi:type IX secretion system substrate protein